MDGLRVVGLRRVVHSGEVGLGEISIGGVHGLAVDDNAAVVHLRGGLYLRFTTPHPRARHVIGVLS